MSTPIDCVHIIQCDSAPEFMDCLRLSRPPWNSEPIGRGAWAFRGQANSEWSLVPRALRPGSQVGEFESRGKPDCLEQLNAEYLVLREFVDSANDIGLHIPGDLQLLWRNEPSALTVGSAIGTADWPPAPLFETLALAQHHGVPTRLLDFTVNSLFAAYFGATSVPPEPTGGSFSIWGINLRALLEVCPSQWDQLQVVRVANASNSFLRAQEAFFIFDRSPDGTPLESVAHRLISGRCECDHPVIRVDAPQSAAAEVVEMLRAEGIDAARLRPTFAAVVDSLNARYSRLRQADVGE